MNAAEVDRIMNATEIEGSTVVAHCVPTRAIRVLMLNSELTFRVEQLDPGVWKWRTVSTHSGDEPWESFGPALDDAAAKQARLKEKIKLAQHENHMARVKALNATSALSPFEVPQ